MTTVERERAIEGEDSAAAAGPLERVRNAGTGRLQNFLKGRSERESPKSRALLLIVSVLAFLVLAVIGWRSLPPDVSVSWPPLLLALLVFVPLTFVLKAAEYRLAARILATHVRWREALEVAVLGAAANLLPVPGSMIVMTRSLSASGHARGTALAATTSLGVVWLGVTGVLAGTAMTIAGAVFVGVLGALLGMAVVWAGHGLIARRSPKQVNHHTVAAVVLESGFVALDAIRLLLILAGLGQSASFVQTVALTASSALTTATGFLPAGLGLRELLVAAISPLVDLPAATGLVVAVIDRVQWIAVLGVTATVLALMRAARNR